MRSSLKGALARLDSDHSNAAVYFFFAALTFAQRALAAARIRAMPAAEMRRFGRALPGAFFALTLAHRARCAAAMRRRAAADIVRRGDTLGAIPSSEFRA